MAIKNVTLTLKKIRAVGFQEARAAGYWISAVKEGFFLELVVDPTTEIIAGTQVDKIMLQLYSQDGNTDVFFEDLLDGDWYIDKKFVIDSLDTDKNLSWVKSSIDGITTVRKKWLNIPRKAYHNLITQGRHRTSTNWEKDVKYDAKWENLSDAEIDALDDAGFDALVDKYNYWINKSYITVQFKYYDKAINSTGIYYEVNDDFGMNDYFNNNGKHAGVGMDADAKYIMNMAKIGTQGNEDRPNPDGPGNIKFRELRKKEFKKNLPKSTKGMAEREKMVKKFKELIADWRKEGNLTDVEHNKEIMNWQKNWNEDETVIRYQELVDKIANQAKYKAFETQFKTKSEHETEPGVAANKELVALGDPTPERIANPQHGGTISSLDPEDERIAKKNRFKQMRELRDKILACKGEVIKEIEALVKGGTLTCPQCGNNFPTLPVEHNGTHYCSEICKNNAISGDNNYTCVKCGNTFDSTAKPPVNGKCPECISKEEGNEYTCANCKQKFTDTPTVKNGKNYCNNCKDKGRGGDENKDKEISQARTATISDINKELNKDPKVSTSELDADYRNWENQIKGFNKVDDINELKKQVLGEIKKIREQKKDAEEKKRKSQELDDKNGEELKKGLEELEAEEEKRSNKNKEVKDNIDKNMDRYFSQDPNGFKDLMKEIVEKKMKKCKVSENELGTEEKKVWTKIKNKEINDKDKLKEGKQKLVEFIGKKEIDKEIQELKKEVEKNLKADKNKKEAIKEKLRKLLERDNVYVEKRASEIRDLIKKLDQSSSSSTSPSDKSGSDIPWRWIIPIGAVVVIVIIGLVWYVIKKRKEWKEEAVE